MKSKYNVIIPAAKQDLEELINNISYINKNLDVKKIIIITSVTSKLFVKIIMDKYINVEIIDENKIIDGLNLDKIKQLLIDRGADVNRSGWYFQQFLKMAYCFMCEEDYYISWDADTRPIRKIDLFNDNNIPYFTIKKEFNKPYFDTLNNLLKITKMVKGSFIAEHMVFNCKIMKNLINEIERKNENKMWYECIIESINVKDLSYSGFSEFETYGTYVNLNYKQEYVHRKLHTLRGGKIIFGSFPDNEVIEWLAKYYDTISFEKSQKHINKNGLYSNRLFRLCVLPQLYNIYFWKIKRKIDNLFIKE